VTTASRRTVSPTTDAATTATPVMTTFATSIPGSARIRSIATVPIRAAPVAMNARITPAWVTAPATTAPIAMGSRPAAPTGTPAPRISATATEPARIRSSARPMIAAAGASSATSRAALAIRRARIRTSDRAKRWLLPGAHLCRDSWISELLFECIPSASRISGYRASASVIFAQRYGLSRILRGLQSADQ